MSVFSLVEKKWVGLLFVSTGTHGDVFYTEALSWMSKEQKKLNILIHTQFSLAR